VDNKLSNHISHGHRLHVMSRRFEERTPLRGGCHPARNQHVGLEQRDRDMMINDSRGVSFMVSGLSVPEIAVEAAACPTNNLAAPIVLNDDPRSERLSITVNVVDGVLALESRHGSQVVSDRDLPRFRCLLGETQTELIATVVVVEASKFGHRSHSCGRIDQDGDNGSVTQPNDMRHVDVSQKSPRLLHGDFRSLAFDDLKPFAADRCGGIENDDVARDELVKEVSQCGQVERLCCGGERQRVQILADVCRHNANQINVPLLTLEKE